MNIKTEILELPLSTELETLVKTALYEADGFFTWWNEDSQRFDSIHTHKMSRNLDDYLHCLKIYREFKSSDYRYEIFLCIELNGAEFTGSVSDHQYNKGGLGKGFLKNPNFPLRHTLHNAMSERVDEKRWL